MASTGRVSAASARAGALAVSRRWARRGALQVADAPRATLLPAVVPAEDGGTRQAGSAAAHALVELTDHVANHHVRTQPARRAAAPSCAVVLLVVAAVHSPVAVILAAGAARAFVVSGVLDTVITCAIVGLRDVRRATDVVGYLQSGWLPSLGFTGGLLVLVLCPAYFAPLRDYAASYHERDEARWPPHRSSSRADFPRRGTCRDHRGRRASGPTQVDRPRRAGGRLDSHLGQDDVVGEGGWGVSAGQARRVALARTLLRDAPL